MATGSTVLDRVAREQAFHDERFGSTEGEERDRFYEYVDGARQRLASATDQFRCGQRVLEIGIGVASTGWTLASRGVDVVAIDISPVAVARGQEAAAAAGLETIEFRMMNAEELTFADDEFDGVVGSGILHHLDLEAAYGEVHRVLKPSGAAVFYEPLGHNPLINWYRYRTPGMRTDDEHPLLRSDFALAKRLFGSVDASMHHCAVIGCALLPGGLARRIRPLLDGLDRLLMRVPGTKWLGWITVIELGRPKNL
ncbi:MAG: SAM-dependent methyltransferase [Candidatus Aldehydirespiratoraceae bacterium]|jgi:SAM-dependent methyltransferase